MGTWDIGPFDNDSAADFAIALDKAAFGEREVLIRGVLSRTVNAPGYLLEAEEAVAAAAVIAAQCRGGDAVEPDDGPEGPMPVFGGEIRALAVGALDRIMAEEPGLAESWVAGADGARWLESLRRLRGVLA
ncbi:DUF4259 domain-containing protein [Catenulispora pinisilvae]|uniref:DUF4259 domain-containing protein n=1 Tax=Catenulispora pinisilvae TaxID=2705253 RepID=UPI002B26FCF6|nr:DUF4259 domain-containing protein [Catenulispora pinisilvae]